MHVGHCRGAVFGDALANLLAFAGYDVTQANITSTTPARRSTCSRARLILRYREALGENIGEIPAGLYPGDYLVPVGQALAAEFGDALARQAGSPMARADARQSHRDDDG